MTYKSFLALVAVAIIGLAPVGVRAADAQFTNDAYAGRTTKKVTLSGGADDLAYVRVVARTEAGKVVFKKNVRVRDDAWKTTITKRLKAGEYDLALYAGKTSRGDALDTAPLTVGGKGVTGNAPKGGTLAISSVPLLAGGTTRALGSVPVAYIKVTNPGTATTSIRGFTVAQNGSTHPSAITSFTTSDDKGGSRATVSAAWKGTSSFVPLEATLAPRQMRIFTIKANLGAAPQLGSQLRLDVASVATDAALTGMLPLRGTVWTIGY